jgi:hypothetical protein
MADETPALYAAFVKDLVDGEVARRAAIEGKAGNVISTSGGLVTLLFGLVAVVTGAKTFTLPGAAHGWLCGAIIAFVVACISAILVSVPLPYGETELTKAYLAQVWTDPAIKTEAALVGARLDLLGVARRRNALKAFILMFAITAEIVAVALLAVAVIAIL